MKKILLLALVAITSLMSCKKEVTVNPTPTIPPPSITINVSSDIIYHPHGTISVSWKTAGMPAGSSITVELYVPATGGYVPLIPQHTYGPPDADGTDDDGQETFTLPGGDDPNTGQYTRYGKAFQIYVIAQYQSYGPYQSSYSYSSASQYSGMITIAP